LLIVAVAGTTAVAHHSYAAYHLDRLIEVEGVLETLEWRNPHSFIKVSADDGRLYTGEWQAASAMERRGIGSDTLQQGDRIVIGGNPKRDIDESGIVNVKSVRRPKDGWSWPASAR
jgi:hypothetical protein